MKLLTPLLAIVVSTVTSSVVAQTVTDTVRIGSLNEALQSAVKYNPTQAIYEQQVEQSVYNHKASKGFLYPNATGSFNGTDNLHLSVTPIPGILIGQPGTTFYAQFGKKYNYSTGITLSQSVFDWVAIMQAKISENNVKLTRLQQEYYTQNLKSQTAQLYYTALIAKTALKIAAADKLLADSIAAITRQRLTEGTTDRLAVNQATINTQNIAQNQAQSQQLYDQSVENLKILLGAKAGSELSLTDTLQLDSVLYNQIAPIGADKNLAVYQQQADIAELQSRSQRSVAYPRLSATAYFGGQQFRDDFGLSLNSQAWNAYRYIGVNLTVPIFTGFSNTNKYKSSLIQKNIAQLQYQNASRESAINDRLLLKNYTDYLQMVKASAGSFRLYGQNLKLNQQKYREGIIGMDIYLRAFQDYLNAENAYLNNLSQLLSVKATLISRQ